MLNTKFIASNNTTDLLKKFDSHLFGNPNTDTKPLVSVCVICYNHANYIKQCLESLVSQQTDFAYEIVIGDDASSDETAAIIRTYTAQYPEKIKAYLHPTNLSKAYLDYPPGKLNFLHALGQCSGKYIVHIEGDDFLTDNQKLQIQADFMEQNTSSAACFHNAELIYEDKMKRDSHLLNPTNQQPVITSEDLMAERETWFMATAAVMFRKSMAFPLPAWFTKSKSGDIPLYFMLSLKGTINYIPKAMSIYRRHFAGMSFTDSNLDATFIKNRIFMYGKMREYGGKEYNSKFNPILSEYHLMLCETRQYKTNFWKKLQHTLCAYWYVWPESWREVKTHFRDVVVSEKMKKIYSLITLNN